MKTLCNLAVSAALGLFVAGCQTSGSQAKKSEGTAAQTEPAPTQKPARSKEMATPRNLPEKARARIRKNMKAHGDDMTVLMWSIIFLDVDGAAEFARVIKNQAWLERPADPARVPEDERVPEAIYDLQDQLMERADRLAEVAEVADEKDTQVLADAFGAVAETCVACHATYLYEGRAVATDESTTAEPTAADSTSAD